MHVLERLHKDHEFPMDLYAKLRQNIKYNYSDDMEEINNYVQNLPYNLKTELAIYIYEKVYR